MNAFVMSSLRHEIYIDVGISLKQRQFLECYNVLVLKLLILPRSDDTVIPPTNLYYCWK